MQPQPARQQRGALPQDDRRHVHPHDVEQAGVRELTREVADRQFTGLATPARIALVVTMIGLAFAGLLALWALS